MIGEIRVQLTLVGRNKKMTGLKRTVLGALDTLEERERRFLELRHGFEGGKSHELDEACSVLKLTDELGREIEEKALRKMAKILQVR